MRFDASYQGSFTAEQCAPYNIRVHLLNGQWLDNTNVTVPWVEWIRVFHMHHGLLTHDGYTPAASVATIMVIQPAHVKPTPEFSGNIVPFNGGKK